MLRAFALRAGELTGLGDDVFFLELGEMLRGPRGGGPAARPPGRPTAACLRGYVALPPCPGLMRGQFDPSAGPRTPRTGRIHGGRYDYPARTGARGGARDRLPGSAGVVEGLARVILVPTAEARLRPG